MKGEIHNSYVFIVTKKTVNSLFSDDLFNMEIPEE